MFKRIEYFKIRFISNKNIKDLIYEIKDASTEDGGSSIYIYLKKK